MKKIPFDLEFVKQGYAVRNRIGEEIVIYKVTNNRLQCSVAPLDQTAHYTYDVSLKGEASISELDLHCIAPIVGDTQPLGKEKIIPFDLQKAKEGKPFAFIDEKKYGTVKRIIDYDFDCNINITPSKSLVIVSTHPDVSGELIHVVHTMTEDECTSMHKEHMMFAETHLRMLPEPEKYIALYEKTIFTNNLVADKTYDIYEKLIAAGERNPGGPVKPGKDVKFVGYFPVSL